MYTSPTIGEISDELYDLIDTDFYLAQRQLKKEKGVWSLTYIATMYAEKRLYGRIKGSNLLLELTRAGFPKTHAMRTVKLYATENLYRKELIKQGVPEDNIIYNMTIGDEAEAAGYSFNLTKGLVFWSYAKDVLIDIPKIKRLVILWHKFTAGLLITCETHDEKRHKNVHREIEARGIFEARKELLKPLAIELGDAVMNLLEDYVREIEAQGDRSYDILLEECEGLDMELIGFDTLSELPDIEVDPYEEDNKITEILLELYDRDYNKVRDTRRKVVRGRWWEEYAETRPPWA